MKFKRFITNAYLPGKVGSKTFWSGDMYYHVGIHREELRKNETYLADKIIGDPVRTKRYSSEELRELGVIGVYKMMSLHEYLSHAWRCFKNDFKRKFHLYSYK